MMNEGITEITNQKMNDGPMPWVTISSMSLTVLLSSPVAVSTARLRRNGTLISLNMYVFRSLDIFLPDVEKAHPWLLDGSRLKRESSKCKDVNFYSLA